MGLSHFTVDLEPGGSPAVRIDGLALPTGSVQGIQIEQAMPSDLPQLVLFMAAGRVTVNGEAIVSTQPADIAESFKSFLGQIDTMALSEAAAAMQGGPDPRNPGRYLDSPTAAFLCALEMLCEAS